MTTYVLEMRNTQSWDDVRYRDYTTSERKAERFRSIPKIQFTDSGHGVVPSVREHTRGARRLPKMTSGALVCHEWVHGWMRGQDPRTDPRRA